MYNIDTLIARIDELKNPSVVGLDPAISMIPESLQGELFSRYGRNTKAVAEIFRIYNMAIIDAVEDIVPAVKPQIAMYERYGIEGLKCYIDTATYARKRGLYVIGDIKRGDISSTAEAYAGHLTGPDLAFWGTHGTVRLCEKDRHSGLVPESNGTGTQNAAPLRSEDMWNEDAITVNPYFGTDGIVPFTDACRSTGKSIYVLVKTSNKSSAELQDVMVSDGTSTPVPLYERVGGLVKIWGEELIGEYGYSAVGAVVGATHPQEGQKLRALMPNTFFLVPGYGAQGASAADLKGFFDKNGRGCIVNSSRGIIAAWKSAAGDGSLLRSPKTPATCQAENCGTQQRTASRCAEELSHFELSEAAIADLTNVAACAAEAAVIMRDDIISAL